MAQRQTARQQMRLAADIGGTFTDIAVFDEKSGKLAFGKALSTPSHLVEGISAGVSKAGSDYRAAGLFLHGSTVAINTMLERTGARAALLITEGFRDIYEIGRINRSRQRLPRGGAVSARLDRCDQYDAGAHRRQGRLAHHRRFSRHL